MTQTSSHDWFAQRFAEHQPRLRAIAYQMLGSVAEAEDALQDAWIRTTRTDPESIDNVAGWLTTVISRTCIDVLRARRTSPERSAGTWLPEPVVASIDGHDPEQRALLADSVGLALLVVMETLDPRERLAFVLHDVFAVPFKDVAQIIDSTPAAARQVASRARRKVRDGTTPDADPSTQRRVVSAFLGAVQAGDFDTLLTVLDPDVVFRADTRDRADATPAVVVGAEQVARFTADHGPRYAQWCHLAMVNGHVGVVAHRGGRVVAAIGVSVVDEWITEVNLIVDPAKLSHIGLITTTPGCR